MLKKLLERIQNAGAASDVEAPDSLQLAAAALLMEVANADHDISPAELDQVRKAIKERFTLDAATLKALLEESEQAVEQSIGVQPLTRTLTQHWSEPQRFELVVALWQVALADQGINAFEEHRIRAIADLLYVNHPRFIEAKLRAKRMLDE